jgi:phosphoribosyl-ATP pyrophosphohydrolase
LKKLGEETAELILALARKDEGAIPAEAADLIYHLLVALRGSGVTLQALLDELDARRS